MNVLDGVDTALISAGLGIGIIVLKLQPSSAVSWHPTTPQK